METHVVGVRVAVADEIRVPVAALVLRRLEQRALSCS